jgi:hypothetical protein
VSSEVFQRSEALPERNADPCGRNWGAIGLGAVAAFVVIALYVIGVWAVVVLVEAVA